MPHVSHDFVFERDQTPFLALCRGSFGFLHTSPTRVQGVALRQLTLSPLGSLHVPNGHVVIGDPFSGLKPHGNVRWDIPSGIHPVIQTMAQVGEDDRISALRTAYLSLVFNQELVEQRQSWQRARLARGLNPSLGEDQLSAMSPTLPDGTISEEETYRLLRPFVSIFTGALGVADATLFEDRMPLNRAEINQGWLENLFEHGVEGSWFDQLDSDTPWPKGSSYHSLPQSQDNDADRANIVICQTGWGDGQYEVFMEMVDEQPAAMHIDFQVIPSDPMRRWRQEQA